MATLEIPLRNDLEAFQQLVDIEGTIFLLVFFFNTRRNLWYFDIRDIEGNPILLGISILTNVDLTRNFLHKAIPQGVFMAFDTEGEEKDPSEDGLGTPVKLLYEEFVDE